jgi:hypothetical protein
MKVTSTKAALVRDREFDAESRLTATLPRDEVEAALAEPEPPELILDVVRATEEGESEKHAVSVNWNPADLERLLAETTGSEVTLSFDEAELARLLEDGDVEAHGLREKALVLTVAIAAATGGAQSASAIPDEGSSLSGASTPIVATHDEATLAARGIETPAVAAHDEATLAARGIEAAAVAAHDEATLASRGITPTVAASHDEASLASRGIQTPGIAAHDEATLASRGIDAPTIATHDEASLASRGIGPTPAAAHDEASLASRGIPVPEPASPASVAATPTIDATRAATIGIAGGVGLVIAAAAFAVRRQREPRPA